MLDTPKPQLEQDAIGDLAFLNEDVERESVPAHLIELAERLQAVCACAPELEKA